ncbi:MAG: FAD/NAD(P)-binding oxidoreductase [Ramlibacter sp.]|nr:FAD/NAD(P)-binding oxidoreductase [Ramlibacter sp.]
MSREFDLLIVGAGPAGMNAALQARALGLTVLVVDDQPAPGGQIWRAIEARAGTPVGKLLGDEYASGLSVAQAFRASGAIYEPETQIWQIEPGWQVFMSRAQQAECVQAANVLLATGAQERPAPFPGWTLPGVLTVGAAQILMKNAREIPQAPPWIAGSGPLVLLYMVQLLRAGGRIAGWLDTAPVDGWRRAVPHARAALGAWRDLLKGLSWTRAVRRAGFPIVRGVTQLRAYGVDRIQHLSYQTSNGESQRVAADLLLVHEGVVPSIHITQALGCEHTWSAAQQCFTPTLDEWGQSSKPGIFVAGDGGGIGGARAACTRGSLAALGIAVGAGKLQEEHARRLAEPMRRQLASELAIRPMLDAMYPPRAELFAPPDDTVVCRCEELTAGEIRAAAKIGRPDPNQIKSMTRAGMGPCQGRQCGYTVAHILAASHQRPVQEIGFYRVRPPLKPLTLAELASLDGGSGHV